MFITKIKNEAILVRSCVQLNQLPLPPNQSLKLTEPAAGDFAARQKIFKGKALPAARIVYMELAARRRSLAPVR